MPKMTKNICNFFKFFLLVKIIKKILVRVTLVLFFGALGPDSMSIHKVLESRAQITFEFIGFQLDIQKSPKKIKFQSHF